MANFNHDALNYLHDTLSKRRQYKSKIKNFAYIIDDDELEESAFVEEKIMLKLCETMYLESSLQSARKNVVNKELFNFLCEEFTDVYDFLELCEEVQNSTDPLGGVSPILSESISVLDEYKLAELDKELDQMCLEEEAITANNLRREQMNKLESKSEIFFHYGKSEIFFQYYGV